MEEKKPRYVLISEKFKEFAVKVNQDKDYEPCGSVSTTVGKFGEYGGDAVIYSQLLKLKK